MSYELVPNSNPKRYVDESGNLLDEGLTKNHNLIQRDDNGRAFYRSQYGREKYIDKLVLELHGEEAYQMLPESIVGEDPEKITVEPPEDPGNDAPPKSEDDEVDSPDEPDKEVEIPEAGKVPDEEVENVPVEGDDAEEDSDGGGEQEEEEYKKAPPEEDPEIEIIKTVITENDDSLTYDQIKQEVEASKGVKVSSNQIADAKRELGLIKKKG